MEHILIPLVLIFLGYFFGKRAEAKHYRSISYREGMLQHIPQTTNKQPLDGDKRVEKAEMFTGNVVISIDYFKKILASLRGFVGGNVISYESLLDRARREATLRMLEQCQSADEVINIRLETATISGSHYNSVGSFEVLASGTAIYYKK